MAPRGHCLVTGGAGFIGSHLVERLLTEGHSVTVIDDFSTGSRDHLSHVAEHPALTCIESTVADCPDLDAQVSQATTVFHLAAAVGVELVLRNTFACLEANVRDAQAILTAAARHHVPTLVTSSSEVYGKSPKACFSENDDLLLGPPTIPRWSYACSKLLMEHLALALAREQGLPATIARIFNTVGPRQTGRHGMVLPRFIEAAKAGRPLLVHGDGLQTRCFCWVHDTVEALLRLTSLVPGSTPAVQATFPGRVVNVGSDQPVTILDLARLVRDRLGSRSEIELLPYRQAYGDDFEDLPHRRPDLARLESLTGYKPATPLESIVDRLT